MGFPSFFEDIMSRAVENGVDLGATIPTYDPFREANACGSNDASQTVDPRPRVLRLHGEEARLYYLEHLAGAKFFAYLHVVDAKTGRLLDEYPYRLRAEVEAKLAEVERKHPGLLRLLIVKRLEFPEGYERNPFTAYVVDNPSSGISVTVRYRK